ncbi:hypothetical protein ACLB2K_026050 [Fragaria x ananassa]
MFWTQRTQRNSLFTCGLSTFSALKILGPEAAASWGSPQVRAWFHRAWVTIGSITLLISLAKSVAGATHSHIWAEPILGGLVGYVLANIGSGFYQWGIDNYVLPLDLALDEPIVHSFVTVFFGCALFTQQFHAWAHEKRSRLPPLVAALQDFGILISRPQHAMHHKQSFNKRYCVVSGIWNEFLDKHKVFEAMEMILFSKLGLGPRSWSEPTSEWTEEAETTSEVANANKHLNNPVHLLSVLSCA